MTSQQLLNSILQEAIAGRLVEQRPEEGTAEELLADIEKEKKRLIQERYEKKVAEARAAGKTEKEIAKIKPEKYTPPTPVEDDEKPFDIPESWRWVRIDEVSLSILYGVSESAKTIGAYKLLRITDIQNNTVVWNNVPFTDFDEDKVIEYYLKDNDILFARTGGTVGKSFLAKNVPSNAIFASYLIRVRPSSCVLAEYVKFFFESPSYWDQISDSVSGTGQPNCNGTKLANLFIPLPPLAEQHRIVEKLNTLLPMLDKLK